MEGMVSIQCRYVTFRKQNADHGPPFLLRADRQRSCCVLHSNDYEERVTCCIEVLPTISHSVLDTNTIAKPWEREITQVPLLFDFPTYIQCYHVHIPWV
ncbi:hypothetical protein TNCV_710981 [Trichonephila clavipes]|nr:hypothetical protein TNCV_710981 [Trichonephila clavipes]